MDTSKANIRAPKRLKKHKRVRDRWQKRVDIGSVAIIEDKRPEPTPIVSQTEAFRILSKIVDEYKEQLYHLQKYRPEEKEQQRIVGEKLGIFEDRLEQERAEAIRQKKYSDRQRVQRERRESGLPTKKQMREESREKTQGYRVKYVKPRRSLKDVEKEIAGYETSLKKVEEGLGEKIYPIQRKRTIMRNRIVRLETLSKRLNISLSHVDDTKAVLRDLEERKPKGKRGRASKKTIKELRVKKKIRKGEIDQAKANLKEAIKTHEKIKSSIYGDYPIIGARGNKIRDNLREKGFKDDKLTLEVADYLGIIIEEEKKKMVSSWEVVNGRYVEALETQNRNIEERDRLIFALDRLRYEKENIDEWVSMAESKPRSPPRVTLTFSVEETGRKIHQVNFVKKKVPDNMESIMVECSKRRDMGYVVASIEVPKKSSLDPEKALSEINLKLYAHVEKKSKPVLAKHRKQLDRIKGRALAMKDFQDPNIWMIPMYDEKEEPILSHRLIVTGKRGKKKAKIVEVYMCFTDKESKRKNEPRRVFVNWFKKQYLPAFSGMKPGELGLLYKEVTYEVKEISSLPDDLQLWGHRTSIPPKTIYIDEKEVEKKRKKFAKKPGKPKKEKVALKIKK